MIHLPANMLVAEAANTLYPKSTQEGYQVTFKIMKNFVSITFLATLVLSFNNCSGFQASSVASNSVNSPQSLSPDSWAISPISLIAGSSSRLDLSATLPASIPHGGKFQVDPSGSPLPAGMSLSPAGILSVGSASVGDATGVIFNYQL